MRVAAPSDGRGLWKTSPAPLTPSSSSSGTSSLHIHPLSGLLVPHPLYDSRQDLPAGPRFTHLSRFWKTPPGSIVGEGR